MHPPSPPPLPWSARILATGAVVSLGVSAFFALRLLTSRCEGFGCTYIGVAWLFWLGVLFFPAMLLGYFAQRSNAFSVRLRRALRAAWAAHGFLALGLLLWWASANVQAATPEPEPVFIEVQAGGSRCVIRKESLPCAEVLSHLRNVVKAAPGTWIRFKADRAAPFEAVKRVLDEVAHSEYLTSAAFLPPPKTGDR